MDAVSATAHYLGDPPRAASASQRGTIPASITKREAIVMVTATATMYFFWPERLWIFKAVFNIVLLAWVTALVFDAREAGIEAWDGIPAWLKGYLGGGSGGGGVSGGALRVQRVSVVGGKNHGQIVVESLQVVVENIKAARLTQDVWGLVRAFIIRCLRVSLDYLEPGTLQGADPDPVLSRKELIPAYRIALRTNSIKITKIVNYYSSKTPQHELVRPPHQNTTRPRLWFLRTKDHILG